MREAIQMFLLRAQVALMSDKVISYVYIRVWATFKMIGSMIRVWKGMRERVAAGQTTQQASDRAWLEEKRRVDAEHDDVMNQLDLAQRRNARLRREIEEMK